jgi:hypothetical protein
MSQVTFKLSGKSISSIIEIVREILGKVVANVAVYATPNPPVLTITGHVDTLETSYQAALKGGRDKKAIMRLDRQRVMQDMSVLQAYIQTTSEGDADKILLVADVKKNPSPVGILSAPANLRAAFGYHDGEVITRWGGIPKRLIYKLGINDTPGDETKWTELASTTKNRYEVKGLISGHIYAFRVATVSVEGMGAWSSPIQHKAL